MVKSTASPKLNINVNINNNKIVFCEACSKYIPAKSFEKHKVFGIYPFMKDLYLFTNSLHLIIEPTMPPNLVHNIIYLSPKAFEILKIRNGDPVSVIYYKNKVEEYNVPFVAFCNVSTDNFHIGFGDYWYDFFSQSIVDIEIYVIKIFSTVTCPQMILLPYKEAAIKSILITKAQLILYNILTDNAFCPFAEKSLIILNLYGKLYKFQIKMCDNDIKQDYLASKFVNIDINVKDHGDGQCVTHEPSFNTNYFRLNENTIVIIHLTINQLYIFEKLKALNKLVHPFLPYMESSVTCPLSILAPITSIVEPVLRLKSIYKLMRLESGTYPKCILIHGPSGVGKTAIVEKSLTEYKTELKKTYYDAKNLQKPFFYRYLNLEKFENFETTENNTDFENGKFQNLKRTLSEAAESLIMNPTKQCIIVLDQLQAVSLMASTSGDALNHIASNGSSGVKSDFYSVLVAFIEDFLPKNTCLLIGITDRLELVDLDLRKPGRFEYEIEINAPNNIERYQILDHIIRRYSADAKFSDFISPISEVELRELANQTHGYTGADLKSLLTRALINAQTDDPPKKSIGVTDLKKALKFVKPSAMKEINLDIPEVKWEDIGGMEDVKKELIKTIEWPLKYPERFKKMGLMPDKGIILHGPPGCSKTMIAKALATQSGLNFFSVKGPELFSKYVGESERMIRKIFSKAKTVAPSIIFFDEIDAIAVERSTDKNSHVGDRVLTQLLTELDGVEEMGQVFVVAATNRIDKIDKALIRPGRLGKIIKVPFPDFNSRLAIFKLKLKNMSIDYDDISLETLSHKTDGYSGAEVVALCNEAALSNIEEDPMNDSKILMRHFDKAFDIIKNSK